MQPAPPTPAEFRELVEAAIRFRESTPWEQVADDQVFGVLDPEADEIGYASIVGQQGLTHGLTLFPGQSGLASLRRMQFELLPENRDDVLLEMRSLLCTYEPTTTLGSRDRLLLELAGFELRRGEVWPCFVSHEPGYGSWTVNGAEARLLTIALDQALLMARALAQDSLLLDRGHPGEFLVRTPVDLPASGAWTDCWMRPPDTRDIRASQLDELTSARLARLPRIADCEWEVDAMTGLGLFAERPSVRPCVLRTLTIIERGSGFMHNSDAFPAPDFVRDVARLFTERVLSIGYRPRRILVRDYDLRELLAEVAKSMDCKLLRVQYLPRIEAAQKLLREHMNERRDAASR
jgi:hypothetical protein